MLYCPRKGGLFTYDSNKYKRLWLKHHKTNCRDVCGLSLYSQSTHKLLKNKRFIACHQ